MNTAQSLKEIGLKATLPRRKILELFETSTDVRHLSAEDVYRKLIAEGIDVGLATVYRVLTQFEQAGLLVPPRFDQQRSAYQLVPYTHPAPPTTKERVHPAEPVYQDQLAGLGNLHGEPEIMEELKEEARRRGTQQSSRTPDHDVVDRPSRGECRR